MATSGAGQSDVSATVMTALSGWSHRLYLPWTPPSVEPVLHETQVSRLLWSCGAIAVASLSTWQCDRCIYEYQPLLRKARWLLPASRCHV